MQRTHLALLTTAFFATAPAAHADLTSWLAAVGVGTPSTFDVTNPTIPTDVDIGMITNANGSSYEFIVNAANTGGSTALMGSWNNGTFENAGFKFEQWQGTQQYGLTTFGFSDMTIAPNTENVDVHLVFVSDPANGTTSLYENGVLLGSAPHAIHLADLVGLGHNGNSSGIFHDPLSGAILGAATYDAMLSVAEIQAHSAAFFGGGIGTNYCGPANANTTGAPGTISAGGSPAVADNDLTLIASGLPLNQFGIFITSQVQAFVPMPGGSQGNLCLGGNIGRYNGPGQVLNSGGMGSFSLALDLTTTPTPSGPTSVQVGESWSFQAWYRDLIPGQGAVSNFTDGVTVSFN